MKMSFQNIWAAVAILCFAMLAFSFSGSDAPKSAQYIDSETGEWKDIEYAGSTKYLQGKMDQGAIDTLTGSTGRTFQIPAIFANAYQYEIYCRVKKITGTPNSKIVLDSRTVTNGTWTPIDSVSVAGADSTKLHFRLRGTNAYGAEYRTRLVKTGSSTLSLKLDYNFKPTN